MAALTAAATGVREQQNVAAQQPQQDDPLLAKAQAEATAQTDALFRGLELNMETYIETANKTAEMFNKSRALSWLNFCKNMQDMAPSWKTITQEELDKRVRTFTILGGHRTQVQKEMQDGAQSIIDSLEASIKELTTIEELTRNDLIVLKKMKYQNINGLKKKYCTILTFKILNKEHKTELCALPAAIETAYYNLKGLLQTAAYPLAGSKTELFTGIVSYPTVDRLRAALLEKEPDLLAKNPFRADDHDQKVDDQKEDLTN